MKEAALRIRKLVLNKNPQASSSDPDRAIPVAISIDGIREDAPQIMGGGGGHSH